MGHLRTRLAGIALFGLHIIHLLGFKKTRVNIGGKGRFYLDSLFCFSGFEKWGSGKNNGFSYLLSRVPGKIVFDIGAHIGLVTLPMSKTAKHVYSFEPNGVNRKYLKRHVKYNKISNVSVYGMLVGNEETRVPFYESKWRVTGMSGQIALNHKYLFRRVMKKQLTLDTFCKERKIVPDVLKIDVEGAELSVLKGASHILKKHNIEVLLSVHPDHITAMGDTVEELEALIKKLGYKLYTIDGNVATHLDYEEYIMKK